MGAREEHSRRKGLVTDTEKDYKQTQRKARNRQSGNTDLTPGKVQDGGLEEVVTHEERPLERGQPNGHGPVP